MEKGEILEFAKKYDEEKYDKLYKQVVNMFKDKEFLGFENTLCVLNFKANVKINDAEKNIKVYTKEAFDNKKELEEKIASLMKIKGVGFPVASAILAFRFPDEYAIIDKFSWKTCYGELNEKEKNELKEKLPEGEKTKQKIEKCKKYYRKYIDCIRKIKEKTGESYRTIEKALMMKGKELQE